MPAEYNLEIITPERTFFNGEVESVIIPTSDGFMSIQKMHEPMVIVLSIGVMKLQIDGKW
jgi:F-type H+-transporting ATPase subunit epsilon